MNMIDHTFNPPSIPERNIFLTEQIDQDSIAKVTTKIIEINEKDEHLKKYFSLYGIEYNPQPIKIYIDSYGGYVYQCFGLIAIMEKSSTPIHTYITGCAMSCGFMIAISGHKRFAYEHATPLYHQVSGGSSGKAKDLEEDLAETLRLQSKIEEMTIRKTKISQERLKEVYNTKYDWHMTPEEALKLGVIDEIV